jgi:hypothetical protein
VSGQQRSQTATVTTTTWWFKHEGNGAKTSFAKYLSPQRLCIRLAKFLYFVLWFSSFSFFLLGRMDL